MRLTKDEREINLGRGEPEFSEWKWATPEEVIQQVYIYIYISYAPARLVLVNTRKFLFEKVSLVS